MASYCFAAAILMCYLESVDSAVKTWSRSVDLGDPDLWMDSTLPCPGQRAVLPDAVMFFPAGSGMDLGTEVVLPTDGMIVFPNSQLSLGKADGDDNRKECKEGSAAAAGDAVFSPGGYGDWHDPSSWNQDEGGAAATPHLRQIPCRYDRAVFPAGAAYKASVGRAVDVSAVSVNGRGVDTVAFRATQSSAIGRLMFQLNETVTIHGDRCTDPRGCQCGNLHVRDAVCATDAAKCGRHSAGAGCAGGLKPTEHCCYDVCGAVVHIDTDGNDVKISMLEDVARSVVAGGDGDNVVSGSNGGGMRGGGGGGGRARQDGADDNKKSSSPSDVDFVVSRVGPEEYELIFVDRNGDIANGIAVGRTVGDRLDAALSDRGIDVWVEESGVSPPSALSAVGRAFGALVGLGVVLCLLYLANQAYAKRSGDGFIPQLSRETLLAGILPGNLANLAAGRRGGDVGGGRSAPSDLPFARFSNQEGGQVEMAKTDKADSDDDEPRVEVLDPTTMTMKNLEEGREAGLSDPKASSFENPLFDVGAPTTTTTATTATTVETVGGPQGGLIKLVSLDEDAKAEIKSEAADAAAAPASSDPFADLAPAATSPPPAASDATPTGPSAPPPTDREEDNNDKDDFLIPI